MNETLALLVKGSVIDSMSLKSPLMIMVYAITYLPLIFVYLYYKDKPGGKAKIRVLVAVLVAVSAILVAVNFTLVSWNKYYGAWVNGTTIYVRYYDDDVFKVNLCKANISLATKRQAEDMLSIRTNGISDPSIDLNVGHFRLRDGSKGDVLILGSRADYVVVISTSREKALVGLPGAREFYEKLVTLRSQTCGG